MLHTILSVQLGKALSSELGVFLYAKCAIIPEEMHSNLQSVPIVDSSVHLVHNQVHLSLKARCISRCISRCICSNYQVAIFFSLGRNVGNIRLFGFFSIIFLINFCKKSYKVSCMVSLLDIRE